MLTGGKARLIGGELDDRTISFLARLTSLQASLRLDAEELCALFADMPVSASPLQPVPLEQQQLYERVFDLPKIFATAAAAPDTPVNGRPDQPASCVSFHHSSFNTADPSDTRTDPNTPLIMTALGISESDVEALLSLLRQEISFDVNGDGQLDAHRLSLMYRHARLATALKLSVTDLTSTLHLIFEPAEQVVTTLDQVDRLVTFIAWQRTSSFTVAELGFILSGVTGGPITFSTTDQTTARLVQQVQVQQVQAAHPADPRERLRAQLAGAFNLSPTRLANLLAWVPADINGPPMLTALAAVIPADGTTATPTDLIPLTDLAQQLERVILLFAKLKLDDANLDYLTQHPDQLGITDRTTLTIADVQAIATYSSLITAEATAPAATQAMLSALTAHAPDDEAERKTADVWHVAQPLPGALRKVLPLARTPIEALRQLRAAATLCTTIGISAATLAELGKGTSTSVDQVTHSFAELTHARDIALGAVGAKYPDATRREQILQPLRDQVNVLKRDALCDYILGWGAELNFRSRSDLYDYFLLDTDMGSCFQTSRIVAATSSVQLYAERCRQGLEQTRPDAPPTVPQVAVLPGTIPAAHWEWRKNFRVWQANRKVFLYPESYIDPDLLDIKTPLFEDLEADLLQQKITTESATDAYRKYLTDFAHLAHLRIAGTYYHDEKSTYYFFGRTHQDPPVYYWRTWDGTTWTPWHKIDLAINAPTLAAIIHLSRLYIFWVDTKSKDKTRIKDGNSHLEYYELTVSLQYSTLQSNGKWLPAQKLESPILNSQVVNDNPNDHAGQGAASTLQVVESEKTYRRAYPIKLGDSIVLRHMAYHLPSYLTDSKLDLFQNTLRPNRSPIPVLPVAPAVLLVGPDKTGQVSLAVRADNYPSEPEFDYNLEGRWESLTRPDIYITRGFSPLDEDHILDSVHNRYPESILTFRGQQYLVHEKTYTVREVHGQAATALAALTPQNAGSAHPVVIHQGVSSGLANIAAATSAAALVVAASSVAPHVPSAHPVVPHLDTRSGLTRLVAAPSAPTHIISPSTTGPQVASAHRVATAPTALVDLAAKATSLAQITQASGASAHRQLIRLSTSTADHLGELLMRDGLDGLFDLRTQKTTETPAGLEIVAPNELAPPAHNGDHLDFAGAMGAYYREIYLHIPWLIARALRADGRFQDALAWYRRICDFTAASSEHDVIPNDRPWRFIEFRGLTVPKLKAILTDPAAIAEYENNPFDPHAIARLRPTAYQRALVMDIIGTLHDYGDSLFAQDTMEAINEASLYYTLAAEMLGPRPTRLGRCQTVTDTELTYERLGPAISKPSDILLMLENWAYPDCQAWMRHRGRLGVFD